MEQQKLITINDIKDIRSNIGFHFTPRGNAKIISSKGLMPLTGDLSSGNLGKEAINNVFFSYGLEGALQIYNNLLYFSNKAYSIQDLKTGTFSPFIPKTNHKDLSEHLSLLEGFELVRQYMMNNEYIVFNTEETEYSGPNPTGEQISTINKALKVIKESDSEDKSIYDKIKDIDSKIKELDVNDKDTIERYQNQRNQYAIELYKKSKTYIDEIRGSQLKEGNFDRCDFDFGKLEWHTQVVDKSDRTALPHNAHTKVIENEAGLTGTAVPSDKVHLFSKDGNSPANGIEFLEAMYSQVRSDDSITMDNRPMLLGLFLEYVKLVEQYKEDPNISKLLVRNPETVYRIAGTESIIPERLSLDMSNIEQYPGLTEFAAKLNEYIQLNKKQGHILKIARQALEDSSDMDIEETREADNVEHTQSMNERSDKKEGDSRNE